MITINQSGKAPANESIEIYYETFGEPKNPSVLLIMGLDAQCIMYGENFIKPLIDAGFYVIRFDNRDIGLSTWTNNTWHRSRPYSLNDMAKDSVGLLDFLGIKQANIIGISMGGMIAQHIALSFPEKIRTLCSIISSGHAMNPKISVKFSHKILLRILPFLLKKIYIKNKYSNHKISVDSYVATYRLLSGKRFAFDTAYFREIFTEGIEHRKGQNPRARYQQFCAIAASGSRLKKLCQIKVPTLIIHGTADPLIDPKHAEIYAPLFQNSKLLMIEGMGHELPKEALAEIMPEILKHLS